MLVVAVLVAGLFVVLAGSEPSTNETADTHLLGRPAPAATGELADGDGFDLARRKGSWVVLNFFTSDCVPCIQEHPELVAFEEQQRALGAEGAELYTVVYDDRRERSECGFRVYLVRFGLLSVARLSEPRCALAGCPVRRAKGRGVDRARDRGLR